MHVQSKELSGSVQATDLLDLAAVAECLEQSNLLALFSIPVILRTRPVLVPLAPMGEARLPFAFLTGQYRLRIPSAVHLPRPTATPRAPPELFIRLQEGTELERVVCFKYRGDGPPLHLVVRHLGTTARLRAADASRVALTIDLLLDVLGKAAVADTSLAVLALLGGELLRICLRNLAMVAAN